MTKATAALIAILLLGLGGSAQAAPTRFTDLQATGDLTVGDDATITGDLAVTGNAAVTGVLSTSAATPYAIQISSKTAVVPTGTPSAAGILAFDSSWVLYVSTGTGAGAWVKVGGQ
jgi:hypothetical protein